MGVLDGKNLLITGVLMQSSIAWHVARIAQAEGATVVLSSFGRQKRITERMAHRLPVEAPVVELDVTSGSDLAALPGRIGEHVDRIDGVLHSIGFAPASALGGHGRFLETSWADVSTAFHVSAFSLKALAVAALPMMGPGGSIVGLTFDSRFVFPVYDWMGPAKAALESSARYLAKDLGPRGIRVNIVASGPLRTPAGTGIPGFEELENLWKEKAMLPWDLTDPEPAARACAVLLSDWFPASTASVFHVDGGVHATA